MVEMRAAATPVLISISATLSEYLIRILSEAKAEGWFGIGSRWVGDLCFAPFRFQLRPFWWCEGKNLLSLETEGGVDAMKFCEP
jgi:hypothetical protein